MAQIEAAVGISDLSYRSIIDFLPCYLTVQDPSLHIIFTNQAFKNDFGDGIGELCHRVYKGSTDRCKVCPVQQTFQDKKSHIGEETVQLSNGQVCQVIVQSAPILDIFGNVTAVIELATNITRIKEGHKELIQLGQSIALVSHGIKNILEGLEGGAYVVEEGVKTKDMALSAKGWKIVKKNIEEISMVVQNILYSAKKRSLELQKISPADLVVEVKERYVQKATAKGVTLAHSVNPKLTAVTLDPSGIRRLLNNLVINALEACERDTTKASHQVTIRADIYDKWHFTFEVEDDGIGMDAATQRQIFNEFFSTKGSEGTGLGLAVVDKVVKEHGGKMEVLSQPGKGTLFRSILRT